LESPCDEGNVMCRLRTVGNQKSHTPTPPGNALGREEERKYFRGEVVFGALVGKPCFFVFLRRLESCEKKSAIAISLFFFLSLSLSLSVVFFVAGLNLFLERAWESYSFR
jgi:hypothetical protein